MAKELQNKSKVRRNRKLHTADAKLVFDFIAVKTSDMKAEKLLFAVFDIFGKEVVVTGERNEKSNNEEKRLENR